MGFFDKDPHTQDSLAVNPNDEIIQAFDNSAKEIADQNRIVMREMVQTYGKASEYNAFLLTLPAGQSTPITLAGYDLSRMKLKVSSTIGQTVIGKWNDCSSGQGFYLPPNSALDFETTDEIYIRNMDPNNTAYVSVWIEKSAV